MLNNLHVWVFVKWELKELKLGVKESQVSGIWKKFRIKKPLPVLVISKKPHRTVGFHENPEKRSQAGFWAVILLLQFGIWVSRPRQMDRWDLRFRTSIDRRTDLGFRTSTDGQTRSGFQDLDRRIDEIWVSGPRQTDRQRN
jgi:hypothetical protein